MTSSARESVSFITTEEGDDLIVAYAIPVDNEGEIVSLILQRTPKFELLLPLEERGVAVSHELFPHSDRELARRIVVHAPHVDIETTVRTYRADVSAVDPAEIADARKVLAGCIGLEASASIFDSRQGRTLWKSAGAPRLFECKA